MSDFDTLIRDLEGASEGSRELDLKIHKALGLIDPSARLSKGGTYGTWLEHHPEVPGGADEFIREPFPYYTASLDDALEIVPEGWSGSVGVGANKLISLWRRKEPAINVNRKPPGLALCIAALKARSAA